MGRYRNDNFRILDDVIYNKGRIFLVPESVFKGRVLQACYDLPLAGNQGFIKTYRHVRERFTWKGMKEDVMCHIKERATFQENKDEHTPPDGLLQPLPIPE
jgi:predicted metal-dependent hydrolase